MPPRPSIIPTDKLPTNAVTPRPPPSASRSMTKMGPNAYCMPRVAKVTSQYATMRTPRSS
eukprot:scaffold145885_cov38-Tisochrysis_lutea.AAC.2